MTIAGFPPPQHPEPYVTMDELAELMDVSKSTVKRLRKLGMPCVKWGERTVRFRPSQAMAWAQARRWDT